MKSQRSSTRSLHEGNCDISFAERCTGIKTECKDKQQKNVGAGGMKTRGDVKSETQTMGPEILTLKTLTGDQG